MNLMMGSNVFQDVAIPVLWGTRAIVQDKQVRLSVIDLSGKKASLEILGDQPAPGVEFQPTVDGFSILKDGRAVYRYNPSEKIISDIATNLPECQIGTYETRIGTNVFRNIAIEDMGVGFQIDENGGIGVGVSRLPAGLAELVV